MRNVFTGQTPAEAQLVAGLLDEAGIECVVEGEYLTGARMELPMDASTLPSVHVRDEDAERALAVVEQHARTAAASPPPLPDDEMPERRGLWWFKQFLLVWVVLSVAAVVVFAAADPMIRWVLLAVVCVFGIVWLLMRQRPRRL
jgi:Flp pilus assembly protein TadB